MASTIPSRGFRGLLFAVFFISLSGLAFKEMRLGTASAATSPMMTIVQTRKFPNGQLLRESFSGFAPVDIGLSFLVTAFLPGAAGWDEGSRLQQIYFLISLSSIISIWSVEAGRKRNVKALTSFTSIWAILYQTIGGAIIAPLYYLAYMWESSRKDYWTPESRTVPKSYAKSLLPSLTFGYMLPTILMYMPFELNMTQGFIAFWQISPLMVNVLLFNPGAGDDPLTTTANAGKGNATPAPKDVKYLNNVYITTFIVTALAHIGTMFVSLTSKDPEMSFARAIFLVPVSEKMSIAEGLLYIFQVDFWILFTTALTGAFLTIWDLKRVGKTDVSLFKAAVGMVLATVCVGPGATLAGVWYLREGIMSRKEKV